MRIGKRSAITAAAKRIKYSNQGRLKGVKEKPWEQRAWTVYDRLPEVHYGVSIRTGIAERIDYFAARLTDPQSEPQRIGAVEVVINDDGEEVPQEISAEDQAILDLIEREGGVALLNRIATELVAHFDVVGRAYVVAFENPDADKEDELEREWRVLSTQELKKQKDNTWLLSDETENGTTIQDDNVYVVWRPHPRKYTEPDSPLHASLEVAEQLILLNREMRARSLSRIPAGIFAIPDTMEFEDENEEGDPVLAFEQELSDRMRKPISDAGSAASLVPWVMAADVDDIPAMRHITFERDFEVSRDDREELIRRLANGLDLPPEILLGLADVNHWTAWQVNESAVTQHVDPTVRLILDSLTTGWFVPLLEASNIDSVGVILWRDLTPAIVPADRTDQHFMALESGVIGFAAARERLGYDENEAPTDEDLALLTALRAGGAAGEVIEEESERGPADTERPGASVVPLVAGGDQTPGPFSQRLMN
ncbi:MAG: hypothetical protein GY906_10155 [bacterium]|nr:hypothetical protein [bacterium]